MSWGLQDVTVRFSGEAALSDISVELSPGQITAVVGGDGAGKTTTCRVLVGLAGPESGEVLRPAKVGYQPAASGTWRDLTVDENLRFVALAHGLDDDDTDRQMRRLLAATNLEGTEDRLAGHLSGGMRQKLGVAMALMPEPELIVLDEPTTGVDPVSRLEIWGFIASAAEDGCAVLLTTTYVEEAGRTSHVLALDHGRALAYGSPSDVVDSFPGAIFTSNTGGGANSWRRGRVWRIWSPDGSTPPGAEPATPDLDDVVTVAALSSPESDQ